MARDVSLAELFTGALDSRAADVWTAAPGRVESYDPTTRTANVRVMTTRPVSNVDTDEVTHEELPILPSVPVCFPGAAGGILISWPIAVGTTGLLVFLTRSAGAWQTGAASGALPRDPGDLRLHHPGNCVFYPGLVPDTASTPATAQNALVVAAPEVRLGDHTAVDMVALDALVEARVDAFAAKYNAHKHASSGDPPGAGDLAATSGAVGATKVKAK